MVTQLMDRIRAGGPDASDAAVALGLLIERERIPQPAEANSELYAALLPGGPEQRLSETEVETAIEALIGYISDTPNPHPTAAWALGKSNDPRPAGALAALLRRKLTDREPHGVAYQAVIALCNVGGARELDAIRAAAREGIGPVREVAQGHLAMPED